MRDTGGVLKRTPRADESVPTLAFWPGVLTGEFVLLAYRLLDRTRQAEPAA